jgi:hypothetical protein
MASKQYDKIVIELQNGDKSVASISIKKQDLDFMILNHNHNRATILEDMISTMEEGLDKK